jgi:pimeloyl-ACP methyl ester carboxylesterase
VSALVDTTVTLPDGRRLAYTEWGVPDGRPVLYFHGTPGSRLWCPDEAATAATGVRLIAPDRPGFGRSDPLERRTYGDWPRDVEALADQLGLSLFAVVGVSAGGAYAAACAALIPARVRTAALVSCRALTQYNWGERPEAPNEWAPEEREQFDLAQRDLMAAADMAAAEYAAVVEPLDAYLEAVDAGLAAVEGDRWFFDDPSRKAIFDDSLRETFRQGFDALKWEMVDAFQPWGFRIADITIPVSLWHASQDSRVTLQQIEFQARTIPNNRVVILPDAGHLGFAKHWGEILGALV